MPKPKTTRSESPVEGTTVRLDLLKQNVFLRGWEMNGVIGVAFAEAMGDLRPEWTYKDLAVVGQMKGWHFSEAFSGHAEKAGWISKRVPPWMGKGLSPRRGRPIDANMGHTILTLHEQGQKDRDIADATGVTPEAVKQYRYRERKRLKALTRKGNSG